jgi:hypothetical protein
VSNILTYSITASSQSCADYFTQHILFSACPNVNSGRCSEAYFIVAPYKAKILYYNSKDIYYIFQGEKTFLYLSGTFIDAQSIGRMQMFSIQKGGLWMDPTQMRQTKNSGSIPYTAMKCFLVHHLPLQLSSLLLPPSQKRRHRLV